MIRPFLCALAVLLWAQKAEARPSRFPEVIFHAQDVDGATLTVRNPLPYKIRFRFDCPNAFSADWMTMPARSTKKVRLTASDPIVPVCHVIWRSR